MFYEMNESETFSFIIVVNVPITFIFNVGKIIIYFLDSYRTPEEIK